MSRGEECEPGPLEGNEGSGRLVSTLAHSSVFVPREQGAIAEEKAEEVREEAMAGGED